ncbi:hypothetical protein [Pseudidiomarina insulisalsae]|uniref:hypothetical protein n=1 Tax=Pseudidiomarina insulisalsae TaxID=575789 RepID=UPI001F5459E1|nr:hypothetical protein [Pseudidiomarina insulisalsae]
MQKIHRRVQQNVLTGNGTQNFVNLVTDLAVVDPDEFGIASAGMHEADAQIRSQRQMTDIQIRIKEFVDYFLQAHAIRRILPENFRLQSPQHQHVGLYALLNARAHRAEMLKSAALFRLNLLLAGIIDHHHDRIHHCQCNQK